MLIEILFLVVGALLFAGGFGLGWWLKPSVPVQMRLPPKPPKRMRYNPGDMLEPLSPVSPEEQRQERRRRQPTFEEDE